MNARFVHLPVNLCRIFLQSAARFFRNALITVKKSLGVEFASVNRVDQDDGSIAVMKLRIISQTFSGLGNNLSPALLSAALLLGGSSALAQEPTNCTPVYFKGQSSATVRGSVGSDEPFPCYTLTTGKGRTATFKFTKTNGNMAFTIYGLVDDRDSYSFRTEATTYKFSVFQTLRATPDHFALTVSVK